MAWMAQISHILHETGLAWSSDHVINNEDVAQVAQMALVTSLPKYAYRSSFSTWAHTVVVQSVCRYLRDTKAKKHG
jgi:DNA-directed RNA polymerase specialized sigma24 family protein